ncbi:MAG: hypothetical protein K1X86_03885 [Ignavibacteria bacterium]|nr:hypothetical protein [Ignavibacteria bacterium]
MPEKSEMVKEIDFIIVSRRIRLLGYVIITGIALVYIVGVLVADSNIHPEKSFLNTPVTVAGIVLCTASLLIRKNMLKKVNKDNFISAYFNAHIAAFILCDMGALLSITTNLFVNANIIMASIGVGIGLLYMWINFPRAEDRKYLD